MPAVRSSTQFSARPPPTSIAGVVDPGASSVTARIEVASAKLRLPPMVSEEAPDTPASVPPAVISTLPETVPALVPPCSVAPELTETSPARLPPESASVPADTVVVPLNVLAPVSVSVPAPDLVRPPIPSSSVAMVTEKPLLSMKAPPAMISTELDVKPDRKTL